MKTDLFEQLPLDQRIRVDAWLYTRCSQYGTPYGVGIGTVKSGKQFPFLVDGRDVDLDHGPYLVGSDIEVQPTEKGLRMKPITHQPKSLVEELVQRLEVGPDPDSVRAPELEEDPNPPAHPAADEVNPAVPVLGELIAYTAKVSLERGLPMALMACIPPGPGL